MVKISKRYRCIYYTYIINDVTYFIKNIHFIFLNTYFPTNFFWKISPKCLFKTVNMDLGFNIVNIIVYSSLDTKL